ncbi:MAG: aminodeoxychorismate synthase, component I [Omnitrophica WOR_2 bacterium RIFCSPLOWO2_01_FULL_41_12]|nr:MAG: aminodeoxychorismate synthase, component I [Omnitrophica WOR_2 bacterium RIFCSPLOWO2_01_FULL_41_12]
MVYYILKSYKLKTSPFNIFRKLSAQKYCFWLESSLNSEHSLGRYSFLGIDPFYIFQAKNRDPFADLRKICAQYKLDLPQTKLPFLGGAVGYFAYDLGFALEKKLNCQPKEDSGIPDCFFGFYNTIIIIDHFKQLLYIFSVGFPEKKYHLAKTLAETNFKKAYNLISQSHIDTYRPNTKENLHQISANFTKVNYLLAVKKAKEYIKAGDIYQVNLAQELQTKTDLSGPEIYGRLRKISPSYFSAYLDAKDFQIISSSPERFLKVEGNKVTTRPMKGTRPRSQNRLRDQRFKKALLKSAKDKAELIMIVDLERNDLGKVCAYDSIQVNKLRQLEGYSTVFQTTATVSGSLHKDKDRFDLLRACFPGGSITGCPKIRAMEIIEELEPTRRSIYTGSLGYLSFSGGLDFNILIRTILKKNNKLHFGIGGGIVADSRPEDEYRETLVKAKAMLEAIK